MKMNRSLMEEELKIEYKRLNGSSYVEIEADGDYEENYQIKMIVKNRLEHFLKINLDKVNGKSYFKFDITSKQQFSSFFEYEKMKLEDVRSLCANISEMVRLVDEYMLDLDYVLLDTNFMYLEMGSKKINFIYLPSLKKMNFIDNLKGIFEYVLEHFDHSMDKPSVVLLYELYQKILGEDYDPHNLPGLFNQLYDEMIAPNEQPIIIESIPEHPTDDFIVENLVTNEEVINVRENNEENGIKKNKKIKIEKKKNASIASGTEIPTITNEKIIIDEPEDITSTKFNNLLIVVGLIFTIFAGINLLAPTLLPINIGKLPAFVTLVIGVLIIYISRKKASVNDNVEPTIKREDIPYVTREKLEFERKDVDNINTNLSRSKLKQEDASQQNKQEVCCEQFNLESSYNNQINNSKTSYYSNRELSNQSTIEFQPQNFQPSKNHNQLCGVANQSLKANSIEKPQKITTRKLELEDNMSTDTVLLADFLKQNKKNNLRLRFVEDSAGVITNFNESILFKNSEPFDEDNTKSFKISKFPTVLGNFREVSDIFLNSRLVSRMHASIRKDNDGFVVEDLNSSNGTYVNEERLMINERRNLNNGDILKIATVSFEVEIS